MSQPAVHGHRQPVGGIGPQVNTALQTSKALTGRSLAPAGVIYCEGQFVPLYPAIEEVPCSV